MLKFFFALFIKPGPHYSWKKVLLILIFSCMAISGSTTMGFLFYRYAKHLQETNSGCLIHAIVQTGPKYNALSTCYLSEVLELSSDCPASLSQFNLEEAHERLLATHVIEEVLLKKIKPDILYIDYTLRKPLAFLEDYTNTLMDAEGFFFPSTPFYSPRQLPHVYLGQYAPPNPWGDKMMSEQIELVLQVIHFLKPEKIKRIDLSQFDAASSGKREVVILLKGGTLLRLSPQNYRQELMQYSILAQTVLKKETAPFIIELRIPQVAYLNRL